jgi:hypothetical protein
MMRTYVVPAWVSGHQDRDDWVDLGVEGANGGPDIPPYLGVWIDGQEGSRRAWHLFSDYSEDHLVRFGWSRLTHHSQDCKVSPDSENEGRRGRDDQH